MLHPHLAANESILNRFRSEAQAAARLTHPGIVAIYDTVTTDDTDAIIMELVEGRDLRTLLDERPTLALPDAVEVGVQLAAALGHAHQHGIIHRDVKPANILVRPDRRVKLSDFGIAKALDQTSHTESGSLVGTVKYLAPEQLEGLTADNRTDLYSLTTLLYEMLCGEVPFAATDLVTAMKRVEVDPPSVLDMRSELSPTFESFISRGLARNPNDRYPNAQAWSSALTDSVRGDATVVESSPTTTPSSIPIRPARPSETQPRVTPGPRPVPEPAAAARVSGPDTPRRAPAKADPDVAKHHRRNRGRLAFLGPVIALGLVVAAVITVWLLLTGSPTSVDSAGTDDPESADIEDSLETTETEVDTTTTTEVTETDQEPTSTAAPAETTNGEQASEETPETTVPEAVPIAAFIAGQRTIAFDPFGGDGEHDDIAIRALDGDEATFWNTQSYRTRSFGNIKEGVGIIVEFEEPRSVTELAVLTSRVGWAARVYEGDAVPDDLRAQVDLSAWGAPIGTFSELGPSATLDLSLIHI